MHEMEAFACGLLLQGRIHQLEYAMEAVKQGSAAVGIKSNTYAILVALKVQFEFLKC